MAFSLKQVKAILSENDMPVDKLDSAAEQICGRHTADLESIKEQRDNYKAEVESKTADLTNVQKELSDLKKRVEADAKEREGKDYDKLKEEFEKYKAEQAEKETTATKEKALKELLSDMKMSDKGTAQVLKWMGVGKVELDDNGKIKDAANLRKSIKEDWGDYIQTEGAKGAETHNPPGGAGGGTGRTKAEIMKIKDAKERQQAIMENPSLFGLPSAE
jgi:chromosome segregation ATPase